jgi:TRAP-type C4-dicarboxylate transport system substrate-binding protein
MKFKQKVASVLLGAMALVGVDASQTGAQEAAATRTITLATLAPPGSTWMRVFDAWNRELRRRSNRTLQFRIYGGGVQGDETEVIRKIGSGRLDAAAVTGTGLSEIHRPALVFQMPGLLQSYAQLDRARENPEIAAEMAAGFESANFHLLGWADVGQSRIFSTQQTVTPADFASRHVWIRPHDATLTAFYNTVRSNTVPLEISGVLGAIQTNRVDTMVVPPVPCVSLQWCSRLTHMTDLPMTIVLGGTVIGRSQWQSLTEEQRTILSETGTQFHQLARRNLRRDETAALAAVSTNGGTVHPVTPAQRTEWARVATTVRTALVGQIAPEALVNRVSAAAGR